MSSLNPPQIQNAAILDSEERGIPQHNIAEHLAKLCLDNVSTVRFLDKELYVLTRDGH
jgi:hypothetical protein